MHPIIDGTSGDDSITFGFLDVDGDQVTDANQEIQAGAGEDFIRSGRGNDTIFGGADDDDISASSGNDVLFGGSGADILRGGGDNDRLYGGTGDDSVFGGNGNDLLRGDLGNDSLDGGSGDDTLYGNKGNNILRGANGDDYINSGDHSSVLDGGADNDTLYLRMKRGGDHEATGGTGSDDFVFVQAFKGAISDITLTDYELGIDTFSVDGVAGGAVLSSLGAGAVTAQGSDTLVTLASGDTILFEDIDEATFESFWGL